MAGRGDPFIRINSPEDALETAIPNNFVLESRNQDPNLEIEQQETLYVVPFEEVPNFRRDTRSYVRELGGLNVILLLPIRRATRRETQYIRDSVLVQNLEELVDLSLE